MRQSGLSNGLRWPSLPGFEGRAGVFLVKFIDAIGFVRVILDDPKFQQGFEYVLYRSATAFPSWRLRAATASGHFLARTVRNVAPVGF
jgi:hypothetical protein